MRRRLFDFRPFSREQRTVILALMLLGSVLAYLGISRLVFRAGEVVGDSMLPTLHDGEKYFINLLVYRLRAPRPGEIVALRLRGEETLAVKRVVALPGDVIQITDGAVFVNGRRLAEDYLPPLARTAGGALGAAPYRVAEECYFVLGDNRSHSEDSRSFGAVERRALVGRVSAGRQRKWRLRWSVPNV